MESEFHQSIGKLIEKQKKATLSLKSEKRDRSEKQLKTAQHRFDVLQKKSSIEKNF
jgi:hypothetical protein